MSWQNVQYENGKFRTSNGGGGGSSTLAGLNDVNLSSPSAGNALIFDQNANKWKNGGILTADVNGIEVPFKFYFDPIAQKYGYLDGADTFHPFNEGGGDITLYFEDKYTAHTDPINYTYTVSEAGQYLAFGMRGDGNNDGNPCIITSGTIVFANSIDDNMRYPEVKIIDCQPGDTIQLSFNNYSGGAYRGTTAAIFIIKNGKVTSGQTVFCDRVVDGTKSKTTQLGNNKLYFTLAINCGQTSLSVSYARDTKLAGVSYGYSNYFATSIDRSFNGTLIQTASGNTAGAGVVMAVELQAI